MEEIYNIILRKGADYDVFWNDMESITNKDGIPNREVSVANRREASYRQTWYNLTEEEVEEVKLHPDVIEVERPPEFRDDITLSPDVIFEDDFTRESSAGSNWGLLHSISPANYDTSNTQYTYNLDGKGVDIVIQDSGVQTTHIDLADRYQSIDWDTESGLAFTQSANHDRDYDGHGTHVAGIAAGTRFGIAKGATIHSVKVGGLEGSGDSGTGIAITNCFDAIKLWHRNKPINAQTGVKRPTVVNMSWGYSSEFAGGTTAYAVRHRGTYYASQTIQDDHGGDLRNFGLNEFNPNIGALGTWKHPVRVTSVDTDVEELIDEGVHVVIASGNSNHKIDVSGGTDYNNEALIRNTTWKYYHRGGSPLATGAINVGNIDSSLTGSNDMRAVSSNHGPGVDIYAPGTGINSSMSTDCSRARYSYGVGGWYSSLSGTSMAAPQVTGVVALILQANPSATPAEVKRILIEKARKTSLHTPTEHISGSRSIQTDSYNVLFNPYGKEQELEIQGNLDIPFSITY